MTETFRFIFPKFTANLYIDELPNKQKQLEQRK